MTTDATQQDTVQACERVMEAVDAAMWQMVKDGIEAWPKPHNWTYDKDSVRQDITAYGEQQRQRGRLEALECEPWCKTIRRLHLPVGGQCKFCKRYAKLAAQTPTNTGPAEYTLDLASGRRIVEKVLRDNPDQLKEMADR